MDPVNTLPTTLITFNNAEISHVLGKPLHGGRLFTITSDDGVIQLRFKELTDHYAELIKNSDDEEQIKAGYVKLKKIHFESNRLLQKHGTGWYKFCTSIKRISNLFRKDHDKFLDGLLRKKRYALPETKTWYDKIISKLPNYKEKFTYSDNYQWNRGMDLVKRYNKLQQKHPNLILMKKNFSGGCVDFKSFSMPGLAVIASYLKQKHEVDNLFVCDSLEAFQHQLHQLSQKPGDFRASMIISVRGMSSKWHFVPENQHKVAIGFEKIGDQIRLISFESGGSSVQTELLNKSAMELYDYIDPANHLDSTPIFWSINQSNLNLDNVSLYRSNVKREYGAYGCETFALRDAIEFLKTPDLFDRITINSNPDSVEIAEVDFLPPQFMKGIQSMTALKIYMDSDPELANEPLHKSRSGTTTLKKLVKQNSMTGYAKGLSRRKQNHYISFRSYKYHLMLLEAMKRLSTEELQALIDQTLVRVDRPILEGGQEPQTLHDLFHIWQNLPDAPATS